MPKNREIDETLLTLEDVAYLISLARDLPTETAQKLPGLIRSDPRFAVHVEKLETMTTGAGLDPTRDEQVYSALVSHGEFDRLLAAEEWEHPAEVLDPKGDLGIHYRELVQTATTRARQSDDPKLAEIQRKLERAWAGEQERAEPIQRIVAEIQDREPDDARHMLSQAFDEYRRQRSATSD